MKDVKLRVVVLIGALFQVTFGFTAASAQELLGDDELRAATEQAHEALEVIRAIWALDGGMNLLQSLGGLDQPGRDFLEEFGESADFEYVLDKPLQVFEVDIEDLKDWKEKERDKMGETELPEPGTAGKSFLQSYTGASLLTEINEVVFRIDVRQREDHEESIVALATVKRSKKAGSWRLASIGRPALARLLRQLDENDPDNPFTPEPAYMIALPKMYQVFVAVDNWGFSEESPDGEDQQEWEKGVAFWRLLTVELWSPVVDERIADATDGVLGTSNTRLPLADAFEELAELALKWEGALARNED